MKRGVGTYKQYPHWAKGPARVEGGYVILDEGRADPYFLFEPTDLVFDLLDVYDSDGLDPKAVTRFARRYGLLYHGMSDLGTGHCREPLDRWYEDLANFNLVARLYMGLVESVRHGPTEQMRQTFELVGDADNKGFTDEGYLEAVSVALAEWVTEGMQGTRAGLVSTSGLDVSPRSPDTFLLTQLPENLLTAAYSQFAFLIANKAPISTCPGCGRLFVPKSGKQQYCAPSCASTSRWRRWKETKSE